MKTAAHPLLALLTLFGVLLAGCQPVQAIPAAAQVGPDSLLAVAGDPAAAEAPAAATPETQDPPEIQPTLVAPVDGGEDPLRFVFPTPGPAPKSAWRPPLYPVPWAVSPNDHFYFNRPIAADEVNWPLADYRYGGIFFGSDIVHTGVDIDAPMDTPVLAAADGRVVWAGYGLFSGVSNPDDPYGQAVALRHDFGYRGSRLYTIYAHMSAIGVSVGQVVESGEEIGRVGDTGFTTGPHLHFEVRLKDNDFFRTRNPELWLAPPQGWGVLVGRVMDSNGSLLTNHQVLVRAKGTLNQWLVRTYGPITIHSDDYYQENVVLSDLPAGAYEVWISFQNGVYKQEVQVDPGQVTYFTFRGKYLYNQKLPPPIEGVFDPEATPDAP